MLEDFLCGNGCDSTELPIVSFDDCAPELNKSEITSVFMALPDAADFVNEGDPAEWAARLSQSATPPVGTAAKDMIRQLTVIGDKPAPTETLYAASNNRSVTIDRPRAVNVTIDETNNSNYDLMRYTECGIGLPGKFWYVAGGYLYGGQSGVKKGLNGQKPVLKLNQVLDRGVEAVATFAGTVTWGNPMSERRVPSPFINYVAPVQNLFNSDNTLNDNGALIDSQTYNLS